MYAAFVESLYFYDRPILFTVEIEGRGAGLAMLVDEYRHATELNRSGTPARCDVYLVVACGRRRLSAVLSNSTTLREAFRFPERAGEWWLADDGSMDAEGSRWALRPVATLPLGHLSGRGARLVSRTGADPGRHVLSARQRKRRDVRRAKGIECRPQRSWNPRLWAVNEELRKRREASTDGPA